MATKLMLVVNSTDEPVTSANQVRLHRLAAQLQKDAKRWLEAGGVGVLTLALTADMKLTVYQVGPELLKEPPQIEVIYREQEA